MEEAKPRKRSGKHKQKTKDKKVTEPKPVLQPEAGPSAPSFDDFENLEFEEAIEANEIISAEDAVIANSAEARIEHGVEPLQEPVWTSNQCGVEDFIPKESDVDLGVPSEVQISEGEASETRVPDIAPTAPPNLESGDFYSLQTTAVPKKTLNIFAELQEDSERQAVNEVEARVHTFPESQVKSLYNNYLLENNEEFVRQFLTNVQSSYDGFELYELLNNYLRACNQLTGCEKSLSRLKDNCDDYEKMIWTLSPQTLTQLTTCDDGNTVEASYKIHTAKFNQDTFSSLNRTLKDIKELLKEEFSLATYSVQLRKAQIEHFFHKRFSDFNLDTFQAHSSAGYPTQDARSCAALLKKCVSTIFVFIRKPLQQCQFTQDCQTWIQNCSGLLLRIATIEDHLFLLNHVLRCPPRIVSKWAASLIQVPPIPLQITDFSNSFAHLHLDYALIALSSILTEVPKREEFLSQRVHASKSAVAPVDPSLQWVVVDSDGEDDPEDSSFFKENDLVSLLHQVPFEAIFRRVLLVCHSPDGDVYDIRFCSDHTILKFLAFTTQLVSTLGSGFTTYYTDRYRQLVKLLGRLILHTCQYTTDQIQNFLAVNGSTSTVASIIPVEYDIFLAKATDVLIRAKSIGTLQFLAATPFHLISTQMLWNIYFKLTKWEEGSQNSSKIEAISMDFENELVAESESNAFYILTTMTNMALAREWRDSEFIRIVTLHLFQIGFLNQATRDSSSKTARDLLSNLTQKYPELISTLIHSIKTQVEVMKKMSLFLLRELSFGLWKPSENDFQLLSSWLLNYQPSSLENQIGRFIIQSINWDFGDNGHTFLPYRFHCKTALLICESHAKWEANQGVITESVKQVSSWVSKNTDFSAWAWEIIKRLHLHGLDRPDFGPFSLTKIIQSLPSFDGNSELEHLRKSVAEKLTLSCMVALLMTPVGHSLPVICSEGFNLIEILLQSSNFEAVINVLYYITPLFSGSREAIISNDRFKSFIVQLLAADMTYMRMAKSLILSEFPGYHTKLFGSMIQSQLEQSSRFGTSEGKTLRLWTELLTKIESWNKDNNILYLLDVLAKFSFSRLEHRTFFLSYFTAIYRDLPKSGSNGIASFLFNWSSAITTLLSNPSYPQMPYIFYFILTCETELENHSGFWKSLLQSLENPKTNLENAVKKASSSSKLATNATYLSIYRWSQQALDLPVNHPILLVMWQKFFLRYFHRIASVNSSHRDGVGERFFEGLLNSSFLKKVKKRLHEVLDYYQEKLDSIENSEDTNPLENLPENTALITNHVRACLQLVKAMTLWIEDPQFHRDALYIPALPPQCLPDRLVCLVEGDNRDWTDYVDFECLYSSELKSSKEFLVSIHRLCWKEPIRISRSITRAAGQLSRHDEFMRRLASYDQPVGPPAVPVFNQILPSLDSIMCIDISAMRINIEPHFKELTSFAQTFSMQISQHTGLDCSYCEHLPDLYLNAESEALVNVNCSSGTKFRGCAGAGHALFKFTEARLNERIGHIIHQNRTEYHTLISEKCVQPPPPRLCVAAVFVEDFITNLITRHRSPVEKNTEIVQMVGVELFYSILELINEETNFYPPTRQLLSSFVEVLGQEFVSARTNEGKRLVQTCIQNPFLIGALAPHLNLVNTDVTTLLEIYGDVVKIPLKNAELAFVILTKLDLWNWLKKTKPTLDERSQLISLIWKSVTSKGISDELHNQMAYETFRVHFKIMIQFDFPQHYGEILNLLLVGSEKQMVPLDIWYDFFNALGRNFILLRRGMEPVSMKKELRRLATETNFISFQELLETTRLFSSHFTKERFSHGIYGLYPKYRTYKEPLSCFLQMISYCLAAAYVKNSMGKASQKIIVDLWPLIRDLYSPWIQPYSQKIIRKQCAQWIQHMNLDESSVLLPWTSNDSPVGMIFMNDFTDSVLFVAETLPGSSLLCSYLWSFYEENYAQVTAKDHILTIVHNCFISIPWTMFWPSMADMEAMNKIVEKYLPACHNFVAVVFPQINWHEWITQCINAGPQMSVSKSHTLLMNLTVRLANVIVARESPTWAAVMDTIHRFNWNYLTSSGLESILNWFVMSIDCRVVLSIESVHRMDMSAFILIKIAAGYMTMPQLRDGSTHNSPRRNSRTITLGETNRKRYLFMRSCVRLILTTASKYKGLITTDPKKFEQGVQTLLDDIVIVIRNEGQEREDFSAQLRELISLMSSHYLGTIIRNGFIEWCEKNPSTPLPMLLGIITLTFGAKIQPYTAVPLVETAINLAFKHEETNWEDVCNLTFISPEQAEITQYFDVSSKDGHYLVLYSILLKRYSSLCNGGLSTLSTLTDLLKNLKPREGNEAALPLIYEIILSVSIHLISEDNQSPGRNLQKGVKKFMLAFIAHLGAVAEDKPGWGLLGALGLGRSSQLSVRGRLFARCLSAFLLAQIPLNATIRVSPDSVGHFNSEILSQPGSPKETAKAHSEMQANLERLEALKLNRLYADLIECIDSALIIIKNPSYSIVRQKEVILELTNHLFSERFLNENKRFQDIFTIDRT